MIIDLHTHTIASGHGSHDTISMIAKEAKQRGIQYLGITDHAPSITGSAGPSYFRSLPRAEKIRFGVTLLYGIELNILSYDGAVDLDYSILTTLDYAIVSLHPPCISPGTRQENTRAYIRAMRHPKVRIIGHPDDSKYPVNMEELVAAAKEHHVLPELNNSSLSPDGYRGDAALVDREMLHYCMAMNVPIIIGSDSHGKKHIGEDTYAAALLNEMHFPDQLVLNYNPKLMNEFFGLSIQT